MNRYGSEPLLKSYSSRLLEFSFLSGGRVGGGGGGTMAEEGVPDMTLISDMDETGINRNLQVQGHKREEEGGWLSKSHDAVPFIWMQIAGICSC